MALSTAEAEYMAAADACKEAVWLRRLLSDFGFEQSRPTVIYEDNEACMVLATDEGTLHERSKHIDIRHHFLREKVSSGDVVLVPCTTKEMVADLLTKPLARPEVEKLRELVVSTSAVP